MNNQRFRELVNYLPIAQWRTTNTGFRVDFKFRLGQPLILNSFFKRSLKAKTSCNKNTIWHTWKYIAVHTSRRPVSYIFCLSFSIQTRNRFVAQDTHWHLHSRKYNSKNIN